MDYFCSCEVFTVASGAISELRAYAFAITFGFRAYVYNSQFYPFICLAHAVVSAQCVSGMPDGQSTPAAKLKPTFLLRYR